VSRQPEPGTICVRCGNEPATDLVDFGAGVLIAMCRECSARASEVLRKGKFL
jgi:hypothetical protein